MQELSLSHTAGKSRGLEGSQSPDFKLQASTILGCYPACQGSFTVGLRKELHTGDQWHDQVSRDELGHRRKASWKR